MMANPEGGFAKFLRFMAEVAAEVQAEAQRQASQKQASSAVTPHFGPSPAAGAITPPTATPTPSPPPSGSGTSAHPQGWAATSGVGGRRAPLTGRLQTLVAQSKVPAVTRLASTPRVLDREAVTRAIEVGEKREKDIANMLANKAAHGIQAGGVHAIILQHESLAIKAELEMLRAQLSPGGKISNNLASQDRTTDGILTLFLRKYYENKR
jgi:hypothetical protein